MFAFALLWVGCGAVVLRPRVYGDGTEYQLMAESLLRHASADMRVDDVRALAARARGSDPPLAPSAAFGAYYAGHGSAGPSRYAVWIAPLVLFGAAQGYALVLEHGGRAARRAWDALVALAVVSQAAIVFARGGLAQPPDSSSHSWAARLVLHAAPAWYSPAPEVFVERTLGRPLEGGLEPAIYADRGGCRKAWVRSKDAALLRRTCGRLPPGEEAFFARKTRRRQWRYVDY